MANPNFYFNNFLAGDRKNKVFAYLPFIDESTKRLGKIIKPAVESLGLILEDTTDEKSSKEITERIYEGINTSRILLFNLSKDHRHGNGVNPNVAYELGLARSIRSDNDIVLITDVEDIKTEIFFDIRGMNIIKIDSDFNEEKFGEDMRSVYEKQQYYEDKRIETTSGLIDDGGIALMNEIGRRPRDISHFNSATMPAEIKLSALRLLDLGIIETKWHCYENGYCEISYYWTSMGRAVLKHMNIAEMTMKEFEKTSAYQAYLEAERKYKEFAKTVGKK